LPQEADAGAKIQIVWESNEKENEKVISFKNILKIQGEEGFLITLTFTYTKAKNEIIPLSLLPTPRNPFVYRLFGGSWIVKNRATFELHRATH
jgi:hypothetical protein